MGSASLHPPYIFIGCIICFEFPKFAVPRSGGVTPPERGTANWR
ncbi:Uncharacterized protein dnm_038300 [Desulfonema magnum]|uniref:Uncharacterized protein n=1 Tax=Desulfonema magnum TaxID=45655 RepID=A0A975GPD2_9BACT|nr:Uncharacterized protein dnm_038300 [Desulfonema magnum]